MFSAILFGGLLIAALFFLWPLKTKIYKKSERILSNVEMSKLVEDGDLDAIKLKKRTNYFLTAGIACGLLFLLEKYHVVD